MSADLPATTSFEALAIGAAGALFDLGLRPERGQLDLPGDFIGRFRLIEPLGEGGFGTVWSAEQVEPIHREIALKLIKHGMDSGEIVARFEAESQALAIMDHPNIAAVLDAGTAPDGRPYFAMELVRGIPLTNYCDSRRLSIRERIELFIPVCQAVQHAHQKAILHRDLKPSNILVTEVDGRAVPKVIDFGISKALGAAPQDGHTIAGSLMGTLQYMSPEQTGSVADVDTRSDIYSLGAILYELLTGRTPLGSESPGYEETLRRIRLEEAPKPSATASDSNAASRGSDATRLRKTLRGDLDWITLKALEKDRRHRYETATALAADLRRYLDREPVSAAAPTWTYRFSKFAHRQKAAFVTSGLVSIALIAGTGVSLWQAAEAKRARISSDENRAHAHANFNQAREAVEKYLTQVADDPRLKEADFHDLRKELLETAIPFYEKLSAYTGADADLRYDKSQALGNLGDLYNELGESLKALASFREAIRIDEELLKEFPGNVAYREALALHSNNFGPLTETKDHALRALNRGLETLETLHRDYPDNPEYREAWASTLINISVVLSRAGDQEASQQAVTRALEACEEIQASGNSSVALRLQMAMAQANAAATFGEKDEEHSSKLFRQSLDTFSKAAKEYPENPHVRGMWAGAAHNFGLHLTNGRHFEEAIAMFREAEDLNRILVEKFPALPARKHALGMNLQARGETLIVTGRAAEGRKPLEEALTLFRILSTAYPVIGEYSRLTASCLDQLCRYKPAENDWEGIRSNYAEAVGRMRQALSHDPGNDSYHDELRNYLGKHAYICARLNDGTTASTEALELAEMLDPEWEQFEQTSVLLAAIVPLMEGPHPQRADECAAKAIELLQRAINAGYPGMDRIQSEGKFAPLRRYPAFMALKPAPPDPVDRSPSKFTFYYMYDDPGNRVWTRDGDAWFEQQPSGSRNEFKILGRIRANGISGTEIQRIGMESLKLFIPDLSTSGTLQLQIMSEPGKWANLGEIKVVE